MNSTKLRKLNDGIQLLKTIQEAAPDAILAGGAIRDVYHNKLVKDHDIFVSCADTSDVYSDDFWKKYLNLNTSGMFATDSITNFEDSEDGSCGGMSHVDMVWEINKGNILYNIIVVDMNPIEYVNRHFDIGLCKAYCDGKRIRLTSDFMHDSQFKHLTIVAEDMPQEEFNHMMDRHVENVKEKYPGYKLVIPERFEQYYKEYNENS